MSKYYALYHRATKKFCFRKSWIDEMDFSDSCPPQLWRNIGQAKGSITRAINKANSLYTTSSWKEFVLGVEIFEVFISLGESKYSNVFEVGKIKSIRSKDK
jgi:hypothetical protein